ncbi:hypothetical protein PNEG_01103 [Pneumocystis murina B123]|uniref:J domain-containing protein n=1 Tax=Pneumocystis murina (strain B123) TaxID=1069680 RepID=M7NQG0_PNEMU|nr:hypothetical protein PNEG_01103 [Pneumocystis murina B123]EMR10958.1 hypothetical protein PNEG_01103 [Pneumocystis murina B123]
MSFNLPFSDKWSDISSEYIYNFINHYLRLDSHFCNSRCNTFLILGLDPKTYFTNEELKEAYRKRLLQVHPDKQYKKLYSLFFLPTSTGTAYSVCNSEFSLSCCGDMFVLNPQKIQVGEFLDACHFKYYTRINNKNWHFIIDFLILKILLKIGLK